MKKSFMLKSTSLIVLMALSQLANAAPAGSVTFKMGDATITHADKTVTQAAKNDALNAGDTIETKDGRLQLALIDGGKVSLQPNTIYKINKYEFASGKEDGTEYGFTELIKGGLRTVSGLIGHKNRDRYQLKTAVATIGIRGTEFSVNFNDNNLLMTTNHGSVDVCNAGGCLNAVTGQSIEVAGAGASPKPSDKKAKAAAAPPASGKATFAASEKISDDINLAALTTTLTTGTPTLTTTGGGTTPAAGTGTGTITNTATIVSIAAMAAGTDNNGVYLGTTTFKGNAGNGTNPSAGASPNGNALKTYTDNSGSPNIVTGTILEANSDAFVKWGRASGGTYNGQNMQMTSWVTGIATPTSAITALNGAGIIGTYNVTNSTAPYMVSGGAVTAVGLTNSVSGVLTYNFGLYKLGYNLNIPIAGNNVSITGTNVSFATTNGKFSDSAALVGGTSGCGCLISGSGILSNGAAVEGILFGTSAERVGLQYGVAVSGSGISGGGGNLYGSVVGTKQ